MCMHVQYVMGPIGQGFHGIAIPVTQFQAQQFGCDLDGDGVVDNQLGRVFAVLAGASASTNLQTAIDQAFTDGTIIILFDFEYLPALSNTTVAGVKAYLGVHDPSDASRFIVTQSAGPGFGGAIDNIGQGRFGPGAVLLQLPLAIRQPPRVFALEDAYILGGFSPTDLAGKLCGAVRASDLVNQILPSWALDLSAAVKAGDNSIKSLFDADHSCDFDPNCLPGSSATCTCITTTELESNSIIHSLLIPDLDLDPMATNPFVSDPNDPTYRNDAISIGVNFEAASATFMAP